MSTCISHSLSHTLTHTRQSVSLSAPSPFLPTGLWRLTSIGPKRQPAGKKPEGPPWWRPESGLLLTSPFPWTGRGRGPLYTYHSVALPPRPPVRGHNSCHQGGGARGTSPQKRSPTPYLHIPKHGREIVRAGAEVQVVQDVLLHPGQVWVAQLNAVVAVPNQESGLAEQWHPVADMVTECPAPAGSLWHTQARTDPLLRGPLPSPRAPSGRPKQSKIQRSVTWKEHSQSLPSSSSPGTQT